MSNLKDKMKIKPKNRDPKTEEAYDKLHNIKPDIYIEEINPKEKIVRVVLGKKEATMHQLYQKQKNPVVTIDYGDKTEQFRSLNSVSEAEITINKYLKGKK